MDIVEITKKYFLDLTNKAPEEKVYLFSHLNQVEKWAKKTLTVKPEADQTVVMLAVWLHDIGQLVGDQNLDHAVNSEIEARRFLEEQNQAPDLIARVCHCVRAHRCKDIQPEILEAKIVAFADSSSHMTDIVYLDMAKEGRLIEAKDKLERDYRDKSLFPELQKESEPLYLAWKQLLEVFPSD